MFGSDAGIEVELGDMMPISEGKEVQTILLIVLLSEYIFIWYVQFLFLCMVIKRCVWKHPTDRTTHEEIHLTPPENTDSRNYGRYVCHMIPEGSWTGVT